MIKTKAVIVALMLLLGVGAKPAHAQTNINASSRSTVVHGNNNDVNITHQTVNNSYNHTVQVTNNTSHIPPRLLQYYVENAVRASAKNWKTAAEEAIKKLSGMNAQQLAELDTSLDEVYNKLGDVNKNIDELQSQHQAATSGLLDVIGVLQKRLLAAVDALEQGRLEDAKNRAEEAARIAANYDRKFHYRIEGGYAFGAGTRESRMHVSGLIEYEAYGFDDARRSVLTLLGGFAYGFNESIRGGYEDGAGKLLLPVEYIASRPMGAGGLGYRYVLTPRSSIALRALVRVGQVNYDARDDVAPRVSALAVDALAGAGLNLKPWPMVGFGVTGGLGVEYVGTTPRHRYTGVGAETARIDGETRLLAEVIFNVELHK